MQRISPGDGELNSDAVAVVGTADGGLKSHLADFLAPWATKPPARYCVRPIFGGTRPSRFPQRPDSMVHSHTFTSRCEWIEAA